VAPNIVFIPVDNVGWENLGAYGGTIPTPRIDKCAGEGIRFNNYNVEVQCTPTRSAIPTGRHPVRSGTFTVPFSGKGNPGWPRGSTPSPNSSPKPAMPPQTGPGSNGPWRGDFFNTPFEGSMRVPAIVRWPGKAPGGVVTEQMLAAVDWLPTLAGITGASNLVAKDRPIDGVDASAFLLGTSNTTGRDSYMFFGADGELMSIKWKYYKTVSRDTVDSPAIQSAYLKPQLPMQYDLSSDPHGDPTCGTPT
jgi:arylsulfatase A-like enzyme